MIFSSVPGRRLRAAVRRVAVCAAVALGACGGGTSQYEPFVAGRVIVFGDETSALDASGQKYSINAVTSADNGDGTTTDTLDCVNRPNWVQTVASYYGFVFPECNPGQVESPQGRMRATAGAKVADVKVQIDAQLANGGFRDRDLTTLLVGANDVIDLYQQYPARPEVDLIADARSRGQQAASEVNRLVDLGAKVIVSTIPDMGLTPYARRQKAEFGDTDRAALLSRLSAAFNEQLGVNVVLDGRYVGLVQTDLRVQAMVRSPGSFGLANVTEAACLDTAPPPLCTTKTLVDGASADNWMWADDQRLAYVGQQQLGTLAVDRARRNPF